MDANMDNVVERITEENALLRSEVRVTREAAEITANLVAKQFEETDRVLQMFQVANTQRKAVLDAATEIAIIAVDNAAKIQLFNSGAEKLLGYNAKSVIEKMTPEFFHLKTELDEHARYLHNKYGVTVKGMEVFFEYVRRRGAFESEWTYVKKDGGQFPVTMSITPLHNAEGGTMGLLCVAIDITQRKKWEREIMEAKESAEAANRTKSTFLANMSHELRTPLNAIIGYSEMLQDEAKDEEMDGFIPDLQKINAAGKHLLSLINDILDLSKIEAGKVELYIEDFEMKDVVNDVVATIEPLVQKKNNKLIVNAREPIGKVSNDVTRVRQVMFNLLSNACKFTENGKIEMNMSRESENGVDIIRFSVRDDGIGMNKEQMDKIFQAFTQADASTTKKFGGTGLGLAISKKLCEMMGGGVVVESEPGKGSSFIVTILAEIKKPEAQAKPAKKSVDTSAAGSNTVLVIDDDPSIHELLTHSLTKEGYSVVSASSGAEGVEIAKKIKPIAITLDVIMPQKDGWSTLKDLKAIPELADVPILMLTIVDDKNLGFSLGATDYLTKPIDQRKLVTILNKYKRGGTGGTAMVVEDNPETRDIFVRSLAKEGWEVVQAENGQVALDKIAVKKPDIILLDLMMPIMDGFEFAAELRKKPAYQDIPIVVVTAKDLTEEERHQLEGRVQNILSKGSFNIEALIKEIRNLVALK